jgi:hypothetical protein
VCYGVLSPSSYKECSQLTKGFFKMPFGGGRGCLLPDIRICVGSWRQERHEAPCWQPHRFQIASVTNFVAQCSGTCMDWKANLGSRAADICWAFCRSRSPPTSTKLGSGAQRHLAFLWPLVPPSSAAPEAIELDEQSAGCKDCGYSCILVDCASYG